MARPLTTLFLIWALLLGPALCAGGLLEHACDCGSGVDAECGHEDSCPDDPCVSLVRAEDQDTLASSGFEGQPQVLVTAPNWAAELALGRWAWPERPPAPPDRSNLPYAPSDRPLLI